MSDQTNNDRKEISNLPLSDLIDALLSLDRLSVQKILHETCTKYGIMPTLDGLLIPALSEIGNAWENGSVSLSQVYMSSRICEDIISSILPLRAVSPTPTPRLGIAVLADHHMLGKRIVTSVLASGNFRIIDYGQISSGNKLAVLATKDNLEILLISTLMLRAVEEVRQVKAQRDALGASFKIIVGGAPYLLDATLYQEVGADAMARSAADVIPLIRKFEQEVKI